MPEHEPVEFETCDVCERTLLIGERSWRYLTPSREPRTVCTLCKPRAEASGWVPEALAGTTSWPGERQRGRRFAPGRRMADAAARIRRAPGPITPPPVDEPSRSDEEDALAAQIAEFRASEKAQEGAERAAAAEASEPPSHPVRESDLPEQLTDEQVVGRALRIFNDSEAMRQAGGLRRTLGDPQVSVRPAGEERDAAVIIIAWDLSWYEWEVEVGDGRAEVTEVRKGSELSELGDFDPDWNASLDDEDRVILAPA